uniref:Skp1-related protein n=1 Tax=Caenorhabditis japonica TaxID=281687 RepID=A0A8R1HHC2_CAEJA
MEESVIFYRLRSLDGQFFYADRQTLRMINRIESLFENAGLDHLPAHIVRPIQLEISATVMRKVIEWCNHHKNDEPAEEEEDDDDEELAEWDAEFFMVRHSLLFDMIRAARDYGIPRLFEMCCRVVGRNPNQIMAGLLDDDDEQREEPVVFVSAA